MKPKIFVDGSEGTTGLEINERLATLGTKFGQNVLADEKLHTV